MSTPKRKRKRHDSEHAEETDESCRACQQLEDQLTGLRINEEQYRELSRKYDVAERERKEAMARVQELEDQYGILCSKYETEKKEKDDALTRLSAIASSRLRDNNPNITDLSDPNRPTKIAEQFSELYDNEWTNAFDELSKTMTGQEMIETLLNEFMNIFMQCKKLSINGIFERVQKSIEYPFTDTSNSETVYKDLLPDMLKQQIREFRKSRAPNLLNDVSKYIKSNINSPCSDSEVMNSYFNRCVEVCWLAVVQDPPVVFNTDAEHKFDTKVFRHYTCRGPYLEYVVWPAMYLCSNGPLLAKGVAQGCMVRYRDVKTLQTAEDAQSSLQANGPTHDVCAITETPTSETAERPTTDGGDIIEHCQDYQNQPSGTDTPVHDTADTQDTSPEYLKAEPPHCYNDEQL